MQGPLQHAWHILKKGSEGLRGVLVQLCSSYGNARTTPRQHVEHPLHFIHPLNDEGELNAALGFAHVLLYRALDLGANFACHVSDLAAKNLSMSRTYLRIL